MSPSPRSDLAELTTRALEWRVLLEALATHARSPMGAARCRTLMLTSEIQAARRRQQETWEMVQLQASPDPMPTLSFPDIREPLSRASKGAALDTHELRDHAVVLVLWSEVLRYVRRHGQEARALAAAAASLETLPELGVIIAALEGAVHFDGSMKESASPALLRLTHQANDLKQRIRHQLDDLLRSRHYEEILQEPYFDQREGRYVLPIKAGLQGRVSGIVHDVSSSGATVFFEPRELVELNNAIKLAELEIDREARRILRELSGLLAAQAERIGCGLEALAELDEIAARASLGRRLGAQPVALNADGLIRLRQARHPLLVLTRDQVVANDIVLDETVQVLIISGPNTGGKTVTLKILGLFALMVRAGLLLPCDAESDMAVFSAVYADIGDAQDLARDLSSFSAHMTQMIELLREAQQDGDPSSRCHVGQALVLLDEPVTSTDPTEGAALAEALLCRFARLGMKVVATTHYRSLKALAQTKEGFANASVGFDLATLSPTYQLFLGVPGGSSALEIAGRLGMDHAVLDDARQKLGQEDHALERMLNDLHGQRRQLAENLARAAESRAEAEEAARLAKESWRGWNRPSGRPGRASEKIAGPVQPRKSRGAGDGGRSEKRTEADDGASGATTARRTGAGIARSPGAGADSSPDRAAEGRRSGRNRRTQYDRHAARSSVREEARACESRRRGSVGLVFRADRGDSGCRRREEPSARPSGPSGGHDPASCLSCFRADRGRCAG